MGPVRLHRIRGGYVGGRARRHLARPCFSSRIRRPRAHPRRHRARRVRPACLVLDIIVKLEHFVFGGSTPAPPPPGRRAAAPPAASWWPSACRLGPGSRRPDPRGAAHVSRRPALGPRSRASPFASDRGRRLPASALPFQGTRRGGMKRKEREPQEPQAHTTCRIERGGRSGRVVEVDRFPAQHLHDVLARLRAPVARRRQPAHD